MDFFKNILVDSLNGFALKDISFFIFQLLIAALLSHIFQIIWQKKYKIKSQNSFALVGTGLALLTIFAKYSVAFSILALAVVLWMSKGEPKNNNNLIANLIIGIIGVGVGSGNVILTGIGFIVLMFIMLFTPSISNNEIDN